MPKGRIVTARETVLLVAIATAMLFGSVRLSSAKAQSQATDWETAAGGKMSFEVASVKQNLNEPTMNNMSQNVPLDASVVFTPTGGLFRATNTPLHWYIRFAYKTTTTEFGELMNALPGWALTNRYDIEARSLGDPTKDQYRLMVQALLADRFKLAVHFETKQMPVLALELDKPGKLGPKLRKHADDVPCPDKRPDGGRASTIAGGFPLPCGGLFDVAPGADGHYAGGARNVPMSRVADIFSTGIFRTYRPVIDETGLAGNYDFVVEFSMIAGNVQADPNAPIFPEALRDQLGLKLVPQTGPVETILVDHIERPSAN